MNNPTWLVTGANGFLGANLGLALKNRARRVGAVRKEAKPDGLFDQYVSLDLLDQGSLVKAIEQLRPDVVVHAAAMASHEACEADPDRAFQVNAMASEALARATQDIGSRFVLISTDAVFDGSQGMYRESDATSPTSVYGRTKVEAEKRVTAVTDPLIIRTNFFGWSPTGRRSILEFFVNALSAGEPVRGFTDFTTSSAYVLTLADALWTLSTRETTGIVHLTSPDVMTKYAFGVAVAKEFGLDPDLITPSISDIYPPREGNISLDVSFVQSLLGDALPTMRAGIQRAKVEREQARDALRG